MNAAISVRLSPSRLCLLGNGAAGSASRAARRGFAGTVRAQSRWGFIGLGHMGMSCGMPYDVTLSRASQAASHSVSQSVSPAVAHVIPSVCPLKSMTIRHGIGGIAG